MAGRSLVQQPSRDDAVDLVWRTSVGGMEQSNERKHHPSGGTAPGV